MDYEGWDKDLATHLKGMAKVMPTLPGVVVCFQHINLETTVQADSFTVVC